MYLIEGNLLGQFMGNHYKEKNGMPPKMSSGRNGQSVLDLYWSWIQSIVIDNRDGVDVHEVVFNDNSKNWCSLLIRTLRICFYERFINAIPKIGIKLHFCANIYHQISLKEIA